MDIFVPVFWLAALVVFLVFEIITLGLTSIWFAGGALAAFVAAEFGANPIIQSLAFLIVSLLLLFTVRPFSSKYFNRSRQKTNLDAIVGRSAIVTKEINNLEGLGEINLSGQIWTARSADDTVIAAEKKVEIVNIEGVKAIVREV